MGAEASVLARELAEQLANELATEHKKTPASERTRNGWDPKDKSENIVLNEDKTKAERKGCTGTVEGVRGIMTYRRGVHLIEFEWQPGDNKYVAIGVATTSAPLSSPEGKQLLGWNDQSVGWNLVTKQIYFNGCEVGKFPKDVSSSYHLPQKVVMVLNMNEGTMAFKADADRMAVGMKGLKHIGEKLYIAAAMNTPNDTVKVTYLGSLDSLKRELNYGGLTFHKTFGKNAFLGNENKTAARNDYSDHVADATVLTNRPLKDGELFQVRLDKTAPSWKSGWSVGVTTVSPSELNFKRDMSKCEQGRTWLFSSNKLYYQRKREEEVNGNLDQLEVGDVVGVKKEKRTIRFYIGNSAQASMSMDEDRAVYGFVDIFGTTRQVTIMDSSSDSSLPESGTKADDSLQLPHTEGEYQAGLHKVIDTLKNKDTDEIARNRQVMKMYLYVPFDLIKTEALKIRSADFLANIPESAEVITDYLKFLWDKGITSDAEITKFYLQLFDACVDYTGRSLLLCEKFRESGLISIALYAVSGLKHNYTKTKVGKMLVRAWLRFLQHCARVSSNQQTYRERSFKALADHFISTSADDYEIIIPIILTLSYLCSEENMPQINQSTTQHLLSILRKSVESKHSDGSHHFENWFPHELAICIGELAQNGENLTKLTESGKVFIPLTQMLLFEDEKEKECALNALWSLVATANHARLTELDGFLEALKDLVKSSSENIRQAATRLAMKLNRMDTERRRSTSKSCDYQDRCVGFMKTLGISDPYLDSEHDKCYCMTCHGSRTDKAYYSRGKPPKTHGVPVGWVRFGLRTPPRARSLNAHRSWHTAYHGTKKEHIHGILSVGEIVPAGREVLGGVNIHEGSKHFNDDWKPEGFNTKQVFLSPSIRYSGVDAYAKPSSFSVKENTGKERNYIAKVAFQVLISPGSYSVGGETIGALEAVDPGFSNQELEWTTCQRGAVILNGLLVHLREIK